MNNPIPHSPGAAARFRRRVSLPQILTWSLLAAVLPATPWGISRAAEEEASPSPAVAGALKLDFQDAVAGELPEGVTVTDAEAGFTVETEPSGDNKFLRLAPLPLVDGGVLLGQAVKGPARVSVKVRADGRRRSQPRFGAGLHGAGGYRCVVVPAVKEVQIVKNDEVLARAPWPGTESGTWTWIELAVLKAKDGGAGAQVEARIWPAGGTRPAQAAVTAAGASPPGNGKASLWATAYAGLPVDFDEVTVTPE